jgi:Asp-tRNA(Asn)/Glu-tRNA(Gln) amidotransferase A subunit family amidase
MSTFPVRAVEAKAAVARRDVSAEALTSHFLSKIAQTNGQTHAVRFVMNDQALENARAVDRKIETGDTPCSLAGIPVIVKENCDTVGAPCSAGLAFRSGHRPMADAPVVSRLRQAGAVILGVSVSDPGAFGVRTLDVIHPQDPHLTVGGSSGGSAAALASGYCLAAIGTDTGGSIRIPSACCGTAGLKPTFAALPMTGVHPLIPSLDHIGPMANTVADLALLWDALKGHAAPVAGIKVIGYDPVWVRDAQSPVADAFLSLLERLQGMGITAKAIVLPDLDLIARMHGTIFFVEGAAYHHAHFQNDIRDYPNMAQAWFAAAQAMPVSDYVTACVQRQSFSARINAILGEVDVILTPTLSVLHPRRDADMLAINGKEHDFTLGLVRQTCLFNHTGHPALTMPLAGNGITPPPSLQLVGRLHDEQRLLDFATVVEQDGSM